ncbi:hypothetical protein ASC77_03235 [Nocardioides sp. Root1257]|uniref:DUF3352 domain-containing protein n=1 Tax=unclassified Nocardioides TaxID=2615069 RepID=UPI00070208CF|nr:MULTISPECIES: DUF3352 domain-containing protein [unclassified Nocardioides]KQW53316.1 hypothetical protein ASC77_03235 [Nocardioides sp. Root1257]KRC56002.1 hypothetical protein ASE24_03235 [Nocardioides sp. Root224]
MPYDTPTGPPPSEPPHQGPVEYLDSRGGDGLTPAPRAGNGRRTAVVAVATTVGVAVVGGAAWAAWSFFSTGAQPAEALPASTLAYASIDLDPSGGQKIEALRTLKKFPAFEDNVGLDTDDDVREWIFDQIQGESDCAGLDYGDDIEPWLGDRFAVAAVDAGGDTPAPVFVVQVSDEDAADAGLKKLRECGSGSTDDGAWAISDGWALVGEDQKTVDAIAADAADSPLADDDDFQQWTDAAGDDGIISMYAAPAAGKALADGLQGLSGLPLDGVDDLGGGAAGPQEMTDALKDFKGAAATVRFDDGGLELEVAADPAATGKAVTAGDHGGDAISTLPDDTAAAIGLSFQEGWLTDIVDQVSQASGESADDLLAEAGEQLGLDLPQDAETLVGESLTLAVDADFDPDSLFSSAGVDDTGATGVGVKVLGNADDIEGVLDKLSTAAAGADGGVLDSDSGDGVVAVGPDADYRKVLLEDGGLGDSDRFTKVVEHADDAAAVVYVNFDAIGGWLADSGVLDDEVGDNLDPLGALGMSAWVEDDVAHAVLKVTTD